MNSVESAQFLNRQPLAGCLDRPRVAALMEGRPCLFADTRVHLAVVHMAAMAALVAAMERIVVLPGWREMALGQGPDSACHDPGNPGVLFGYDFHITPQGPRLIEINTNAGGLFLNAHAQSDQGLEQRCVEMFLREWTLAGRSGRPGRLAIVDEDPADQYLAPEFELCRSLLQQAGIDAFICDPRQLDMVDGRLQGGGRTVDMVYNRLTDFALDAATSGALRDAWLSSAVVLTPHPRAHALYADKRNLIRLSDDAWLASIGVDGGDRELLARVVPGTEAVVGGNGDALWSRRKGLFFKPAAGFGSRAAYRGDKLTRRVFEEILAGNYVAQEFALPGERVVRVDGAPLPLKYDLRCYAYRGEVLATVARLWQGQTTNFRTPGGGFAEVEVVE
ncbi:hypothetical protein [Denitratisoma oestradiolicum]|uniref:Circularly permuted type 2 ATP-grasp protein n=1 Tax=Denitratisoma oestradiolicum TaxID=311182 RepID=A0A6S6Y6D5_9PROT|nr:hypothetical protein [Denitratisoma oestradiolicum]TWO79437.1 hypothetical protein CBW56_14965 [Denitratisoma oestradiolicum]CAB1368148.1 conserved protein of unknown function [Denitratisoma oestradiolicum]